jgi:succinoglycan biosynthesis transport protein ExoP
MTATAPASYVSITRRTLDLEDYIDIARRHIGWILGPAFAGVVISVVVAFLLPNVYYSSAELEITPAQVSDALVPAAVTQQLTDRIVSMETQILSRTSLSQIIQDPKLDLYRSMRAKQPLDDVIDEMQRNIHVELRGLDGSGRHASAFRIGFFYSEKTKARDTVGMLVTKFTDANQRAQREVQQTVNGFTSSQVRDAKADLDKLDQTLTKFRQANPGRLPEQVGINISELNTLNGQLAGINDALNRRSQDKANLETRVQTVNSQLDNYRLFEQTSADLNSPQGMENERIGQLTRTITDMETNLALMRRTFKDNYPDIRGTETHIQVLRTERDALVKKQQEEQEKRQEEVAKKKDSDKLAGNNLNFASSVTNLRGEAASIKTQLKLIDQDITNLEKARESVSKEIEGYKARLAATSGIEADYEEMLRQERLANGKYEDLLHKQQIVDENGELVQRQAGEQLNELDPPSTPDKPAAPKRYYIIGVGSMVSLMLGLALAGVQEARDSSLKNLKDVRAYTNLPVLSSIPLLENSLLVKRKRRVAYLAWSAGIIMGVIAVSCALYYHFYVAA